MVSRELTYGQPSGGGGAQPQTMRLTDVVFILRQKKALLIVPFLASLVMGAAYLSNSKPFFKVRSRILVNRQHMPMDVGRDPGREDEFLATQVEILASPSIIERVAQKQLESSIAAETEGLDSQDAVSPGSRSLDSNSEPEDLLAERVDLILGAMKVKRVLGTDVLNLSFHADTPDFATSTLQRIIDSYQEYLRENDQDTHLEILRLLTRNEKDLRDELTLLNDEYRSLRVESPVMGGQGEDAINVPWKTIDYYNKQLTELKNQRIELEHQIRQLDLVTGDGVEAGDNAEIGEILEQQQTNVQVISTAATDVYVPIGGADISGDVSSRAQADFPSVVNRDYSGIANSSSVLQQLMRLQASVHELRLEFGERHPEVAATVKKIEYWEKLLEERLHARLAQMHRQLDSLRLREEEASKVCNAKVLEAKELDGFILEEKQAWDRIQLVQSSHQAILAQVRELQLNGAALNDGQGHVNVRVLEAPEFAKRQVWPPPILLMSVCGVVGLVAGVGLIGFLEYADAKVWSEDQVGGSLNCPVVGGIPAFATTRYFGRDSLQRYRLAHYAPGSAFAEAIRTLRTRLNGAIPGHGLVIQITSPMKGDGKSTVTANLAFSFAQLGKKVIVVDADLRAGGLHRAFDVPLGPGLTAVLRGTVELEDAIETSPLANVDVLPCGTAVHDPAELLASSRLDAVLSALRQHYDLVLTDTAPLLVSDSLVIAPKVDGVLLNVTVGRSSVRRLQRACELLESLGASLIGVVVNELRHNNKNDGYGYIQQLPQVDARKTGTKALNSDQIPKLERVS